MTDNYHTPIPEGAAANAQTFNDPLGEMDEALTEALLAERDGHIIQEEGVDLAQQPRLDFVGAGVTATNSVGKTTVTIPGGVTDHGALSGLADDDHTQYHNDTRGDARYPLKYTGKTTAPTVNDDSGDGYAIGDRWLDTTNDKEYVALDVTVGASVWVETTITSSGAIGKNILANGGFQVAQRGAGPFTSVSTFVNSDDKYLLDMCNLLSDGNDIVDVSQVADTDFVSGYKIRLDVETANKRFGILLPVESKDIQDIRKSGLASLQFKVKRTGTSIANVRAYLLAWNGTADSITSDVISAWGSAGADPTFVANWTAENVAANIPITTTIATKTIENIVVDTASVANLAVLIIVDDTDATIGDFLEIGDVKLESGATATAFVNEFYKTALELCQRYAIAFFAPNTNATFAVGMCTATTQGDFILSFPVEMRAAPSLVSAGTFRIYQAAGINASSISLGTGIATKYIYVKATVVGATANAPALFQDQVDGSAKMLFTAEL